MSFDEEIPCVAQGLAVCGSDNVDFLSCTAADTRNDRLVVGNRNEWCRDDRFGRELRLVLYCQDPLHDRKADVPQ